MVGGHKYGECKFILFPKQSTEPGHSLLTRALPAAPCPCSTHCRRFPEFQAEKAGGLTSGSRGLPCLPGPGDQVLLPNKVSLTCRVSHCPDNMDEVYCKKLTLVIMEAEERQDLQDGKCAGDPEKETAWLQTEGPQAPDPRKGLLHLESLKSTNLSVPV